MQKGAVWLARPGTSEKRLRRVSAVLRAGDVAALYYDGQMLARIPPRAECRQDVGRFSIWFKPAGLMTQGTRFGDHCSLLRQAEIFLRPGAGPSWSIGWTAKPRAWWSLPTTVRRPAHFRGFSRSAGSSIRLPGRDRGRIGVESASGRIDLPLDGKPAVTEYTLVSHDAAADISVVDVVMQTGRKHQIRRHFALGRVPGHGRSVLPERTTRMPRA